MRLNGLGPGPSLFIQKQSQNRGQVDDLEKDPNSNIQPNGENQIQQDRETQKKEDVPEVQEEIKINSIMNIRLELAIEKGKIEVKVPLKKFKIKTIKIANRLGDAHVLSQTDLELLALALELKNEGLNPLIITDDYSIQNVANKMKIEFSSLTTKGINRLLKWIRYCPACYKKFNDNISLKICSICGTKLKRKQEKEKSKEKSI